MNTFRYRERRFLLCVAAIGVAGDALLRPGPLGLNVTLCCLMTLGVVWYQARACAVELAPPAHVLIGLAAFFAVVYVWRDVNPINALILGVIGVSVILAAASRVGRDPRFARLWDYAADAFRFGIWTIRLPFVLVSQAQHAERSAGRGSSRDVFAVLRGILFAAPLVILFGALLMSADALYEQFLTNLIAFDIETIVSHVMLTAFCAWAAAAVLWQCLEGPVGDSILNIREGAQMRWGAIEVNVALGIVTTLFVSFIAVQARYRFGGHERVLTEAGLTYADYARRGFFELAVISAISLGVLVLTSRVVETASEGGRRAYKIIGAGFILSVVALIASALHRMNLYIDAYGLTQMRLYTAVFMGWMTVVFAWLYLTIAREQVGRFAWGLVLTGYAATFFLVAVNPDAAVARINLARAAEGKALDIEYMKQLGADAISPMVEALPTLPDEDRKNVEALLAEQRIGLDERDLRTWTLGLARARAALREWESKRAVMEP